MSFMKGKKILFIMILFLTLQSQMLFSQNKDDIPQKAEVLQLMDQVFQWQKANPGVHDHKGWLWAAFLAGVMEYSRISEQETEDWLIHICEENGWRLHDESNLYHADDHAVGWVYLELYRKYGDPKMIVDIQNRFDAILENPSPAKLKMGTPNAHNRWSWCDALFMSPPVFFSLSDAIDKPEYLKFANQEWWAVTDYLYRLKDQLYLRDSTYFHKRERNLKRVYWGRGNGWVIGGLVRVLQYLPDDHPDRVRYLNIFKEMSAKLVSIQGDDGFWRASLLDPKSYPSPETSATAFFCYGLLAGINNGWLDDSYLSPALKSWNALVSAVHENGKLGWIQPVGQDPKKVTRDMTEVYGVGGFLLAGSELSRLIDSRGVQY